MSETTQDFSELAIPEEPGVYWCWRHRKVKTRLRCGRCEKPICPKCTVMGPTGARCRECASNRSQHIYRVSPLHLVLTLIASTILSVIGISVLHTVGIYLLFFAPIIGAGLSKVITVITRGKRGPVLATVASLGTTIGALIPSGMHWLQAKSLLVPGMPPELARAIGFDVMGDLVYVLIYLALAIPAIWYWVK